MREGRAMSDAKEHVREVARQQGIEIEDSRLDQLAEAWKQAMKETESIRQQSNPSPKPAEFDASWSEKR